MTVAPSAMPSVTRAPYNIRVHTSRPAPSTPSQCSAEGPASASARYGCSVGPCRAMTGASSAASTITANITRPVLSPEFRLQRIMQEVHEEIHRHHHRHQHEQRALDGRI